MSNYQTLLAKLDAFIRKYYKNMLIRGGIYTAGLGVSAFLLVAVLEYFGQFDTGMRAFLFWSFAGFIGYILVRFVAIPLSKLYRIGKTISYEQASQIIGDHFGEVRDRLLNTLQLQQAATATQSDLLEHAISQKIEEMRPVTFTSAINLRHNMKYLRYALLPVGVFVCVMLVSPAILTDSGERLVKFNKHFERKAPFDFVILNKNLQTAQGSDFVLELKTSGNLLPDEVELNIEGKTFRMEKKGKTLFRYTLQNLQRSQPFHFLADEYSSSEYELKVIPQPRVLNFEVQLHYLNYLNKPDENLQNTGDFTVPAGTTATWKFSTSNVEQLSLLFSDKSKSNSSRSDDIYTFSRRFLASQQYSIKPSNRYLKAIDSINYTVSVSPDAFPSIEAEETKDTASAKISYFSGTIADDYGLTRLSFKYRFLKSEDKSKAGKGLISTPIQIDRGKTQQPFYHYINLSEIGLEPGDEVEYYFEVWDNDGVSGSKSSRSQSVVYKAPTMEEMKQQDEQSSKEVKKELSETLKDVQKLQKDMKKLQEKLAEKKQMGWEERKQMEEILKRHEQLQKQVEEIKKDNQQRIENKQEMQQNEELMQKQQELQKLMNQLFDEDMKKLMDEMQELMKQNDKEQIEEKMNDMQVQDKEVQKELDRMLEMFKKMELDEKRQQAVDKLDELQKKQDELSKESKDKDSKPEDLEKKQDEIKKEFDELKKDLKDIEKKNEELDKPEDIENTDKEQKAADDKMESGKQNLKKKNKKQASDDQKEAAEEMKKMKEKMEKNMEKEEQEQEEEDYNNLRQILENLLKLSFDQEALMEELKTVNGYNPQFVRIGQQQKKLKDDARLIEDSLLSLSKRQIRIQPIINKEIGQVNANMDRAIGDMADRQIYQARTRQQYVMTHVNNLALMLSQILKQMQDEMNGPPKDGQCKKPGKGKKGKGKPGEGEGKSKDLKGLGQMQKELAKQIEQMKKGMKPGQKGKPGENGMPGSKEFAKAAAQQAAIRQRLRELSQQYGKEGGTQLKQQLEQIQKMMDQNEKELYNKQLTPEMMRRQQDIEFRLLESEKARQEQETDNQRKATAAQEKQNPSGPKRFEEFVKQKNRQNEILRTIPPNFSPYYKNRVKDYFDKTGK